MERINCRKCVHFYITWEKTHPYGCRAMGFKTDVLPSVRVYQSSGVHCLRFVEKKFNKE
ncbi:uracil-DNA glycosylase [Seleniivibrio woodruffii]|uniref:Uracil-DNA glycosylase n=1 Tax=Seleniivibrio woodruffii TaxID=1078050 RepID=A0A4V2PSG9_9BACT|nr:uracil-DNA glycosylase [Seleniivibrio woodruffii]TCK62511.1 hypothetical protein C8D98_1040 [Seleniivibrio woodruffii]TVZ37062.1 hypothetical protein OF66_2708 [Seleniivibrio woodruffii]